MLGYYQNPEANKKAFTDDGWLDTGDVGILTEGKLIVTARTKDEIIISGVNYLASEIETITEAIKGVEVSYSAACAVRYFGNDTDELAVFFSPVLPSQPDSADVELKSILRSILEIVSSNAGIKPDYLIPLKKEQIPKTNIGKIQRSLLKKQFEAGDFDEIQKQVDLLLGINTIPDWFYRTVWSQKNPSQKTALTDSGVYLIFKDTFGFAENLCEQLQGSGKSCITVVAAQNFRQLSDSSFAIDPSNQEHYQYLLEALREKELKIAWIIHCWAYDKENQPISSVQDLGSAQKKGTYSLLNLVQALIKNRFENEPINLFGVGTYSQVVFDSDECSCTHSTMIGMLKTMAIEIDWLNCRHIDLQANSIEQDVVHVIEEMKLLSKDDEVAYRNGKRLAWGLEAVDLAQEKSKPLPIKTGEIYLITGGLGGIGSYLAQIMVKEFKAKLILIGSSILPERSTWSSCLEQGGKLAERIRQYIEIESLGADFVYESCDVADLSRLRKIVNVAEKKWKGNLAGIFHLAAGGDLDSRWQNADSGYLSNTTIESFDHMFRSKVYGSWAVYELVKERPDAIVVSFGSVIGVFGATRYAAYASAHTFLSNFTLQQRYHWHTGSYRFAWAVWDDIGLSKNEPASAHDFYRSIGYYLIPKKTGIDCLMAGLIHDQPDLIVGLDVSKWNVKKHQLNNEQPLQQLTAYYVTPSADEEIDLERVIIQDQFGVTSHCNCYRINEIPLTEDNKIDYGTLLLLNQEKRDEKQDNILPRTDLEKQIHSIWVDVLAASGFGIQDSFFQVGGNSLTATQVLSRFRQIFNISLEMRDLFDAATISEMASLIENRQTQTEQKITNTDFNKENNSFNSLSAHELLTNIDLLSEEEVADLLRTMQREGEA